MDVFSQLLENSEEGGIYYHPRCEELDLSHVSFANDLFIMAAASHKSMKTIQKTLEEFSWLSGLKPNLTKSEFFAAGISEEQSLKFSMKIGAPLGKLPFKYLGVSLISTKLN